MKNNSLTAGVDKKKTRMYVCIRIRGKEIERKVAKQRGDRLKEKSGKETMGRKIKIEKEDKRGGESDRDSEMKKMKKRKDREMLLKAFL